MAHYTTQPTQWVEAQSLRVGNITHSPIFGYRKVATINFNEGGTLINITWEGGDRKITFPTTPLKKVNRTF